MHLTDSRNPLSEPAIAARSTTPADVFVAQIQPGGQVFEAPSDEPLLLAAQRAGIAMTSSCRNGTCRACLCQLVSGAVTYCVDWPGVSADEKRDGLILPCVACAASDLVMAPPPQA